MLGPGSTAILEDGGRAVWDYRLRAPGEESGLQYELSTDLESQVAKVKRPSGGEFRKGESIEGLYKASIISHYTPK